ncbi:MAG: metallopeptidase family protein [Anaerolineales bacterium]|nr:metallopeptidase family protein [Anaerolineales bacterium]
MRTTPERFEQLVFEEAEAVLAQLPPGLRAEAETVILQVEDQGDPTLAGERRMLLGLYEGVPLVERHADTTLLQPDRITLYRLALQSLARTEIELRRQIRRTLVHELAHFFGRDEDELRARGWA